MKRRETMLGAWALAGAVALAGAPALRAQTPELGLSARSGEEGSNAEPELGLGNAGVRRAPTDAERVDAARRQGAPYVPIWGAGYYAGPWNYYILPSAKVKAYPDPFDPDPRLGLHYTYPANRQFGIQIPYDASPLRSYSLGAYQGVVGSPSTPDWLDRSGDSALLPAGSGVLELFRDGRFREAGRVLAERFRTSDDPRYPLLLAEALFGLGSYRNAELVLRHALNQPNVAEALPEDVAQHFPSRDEYERRVEELTAKDEGAPLLTAYLLLFSDDPADGLARLGEMITESQDERAAVLYRHYLGQVFGHPEEDEAAEPNERERTAPEPENDEGATEDESSESGSPGSSER